jgi:Sulfotransferase domain
MSKTPNFLYIGTSKAGSTWIFKVLSWHPEIYMYPGKNLGYFSTRYDKGWDWYLKNFDPEPQHKLVGEVSHSYLVSEEAAARVHKHLPDAKLMVCLREPVQRTFSDYLDAIKNGKLEGTFEEELERTPGLIHRSRYGTHLERYLQRFDRSQLHIATFDELVSAPDQFAARMFEFLGVERLQVPSNLHEKVLPAGKPRSRALANGAKKLSRLARRTGLTSLRGKVKTSRTVRNALYQPFTETSRPSMSPDTQARLRALMSEEMRRLDAIAGTDFSRLWKYSGEEGDGHAE